MVKNVEGIVVVEGNSVALNWRWGIGGMVGGRFAEISDEPGVTSRQI